MNILKKILKLLNPQDSKYSLRIEEIGALSLVAGETEYKIMLRHKNICFTYNALELKEKNLIDRFSAEDAQIIEQDLQGNLFQHLSQTYNI